MSDVLELASVSVVRGSTTLLDDVTWDVPEGERWVVLGPNGAGKTTLLQLASGRMHPTHGVVGVLGEILGRGRRVRAPAADRPGQRGAGRADPGGGDRARRRGHRRVRRGRALAGELRRRSTTSGPTRLLDAFGLAHLRRPHLRHAERGRAQAGPDRPVADDRPRAAAARRARRRPGPRRARGPGPPAGRAGRATRSRRPWCWSRTTSRRSRRASPTCCCCAAAAWSPAGPIGTTLTAQTLGARRSAVVAGARTAR